MTELRVLDLFAGLGGASSAFRERGHHVVGVDQDRDLLEKPVDTPWSESLAADIWHVTPKELHEAGVLDRRHRTAEEQNPYEYVWPTQEDG